MASSVANVRLRTLRAWLVRQIAAQMEKAQLTGQEACPTTSNARAIGLHQPLIGLRIPR